MAVFCYYSGSPDVLRFMIFWLEITNSYADRPIICGETLSGTMLAGLERNGVRVCRQYPFNDES